MFNKVLIANRGAIATRIIRTLNTMQIGSVAVYSESDAKSLHVKRADEAYSLGEGSASDTYLDMDKILNIAKQSGAQAIHPGYGFLSENAAFVRRCEEEGIAFIGPTAEQMIEFGLKHRARELAEKANVPLSPGSELLTDLDSACQTASAIGYPVMLKSTAGGGGIGMHLCHDEKGLRDSFDSVRRLGANNFADDGVFLEKFIARARHIEVQIFADGKGSALALGERDCSSQRRNQKVVEECPAPNLTDEVRKQLHQTAELLLSSVQYRNAGTVEFIYDMDTDEFYFLEVNTRLQVEHGVTEMVYGVDLVEWMIRLAAGEDLALDAKREALKPKGHAVQVRLYAEDPYKDFQPCAGLLSQVQWPLANTKVAAGSGVRIDTWVETGIEVSPYFDPMLAKVIIHQANRESAFAQLKATLDDCVLYGTETNLDYLKNLVIDPVLLRGEVSTRYLNQYVYQPERIDVLSGGTQTTLQDFPGRQHHWNVGVPPSGPFDNYHFRLANRLLNNPDSAAAMEITLQGPSLKFSFATCLVVCGAMIDATIDGQAIEQNQVVTIKAGETLALGRIKEQGARAYLAVAGGFDCPDYLGSKSTFTLGHFGGHNGRAIQTGDVLHTLPASLDNLPTHAPGELVPQLGNHHELRVIYGPHGSPDFFTPEDIQMFFSTDWEIHYNSSRTGVRLIGPKPKWARNDGGEAGLHPSNIHDNAYAFGSVDFTGDMPVILGPDGPSLGGFVCPATVITADLWKLGQLRAGDKIRFIPVTLENAVALEAAQNNGLANLTAFERDIPSCDIPCEEQTPILKTLSADRFGDEIVYRAAGDHFLLVEYGEQILDIRLRFRAHALMQWLEQNPLAGMRELTPGIRSLQIHYDSQQLSYTALLGHLETAEQALSTQLDELTVPSRIVYLPLSWDDRACQEAIDKYAQSVRSNAPWCPSNLEFIRRINGLDSINEVKDILFSASYLVMGLGDVYLGAPVATPVDPRHRLVTTKYNPARTWTAENSVGIGGSYLCVYGMEGPGGYQFVGRTLQMWNRYRQTSAFSKPWLLRFFDQIRFYEVSHEELEQIRKDFPHDTFPGNKSPIRIEESTFSLSDYQSFIDDNQDSIESFKQGRNKAFEDELARWHANGQFHFDTDEAEAVSTDITWSEDATVVDSPVSGSVWQTQVAEGDQVQAGQLLVILESMKMEIPIYAPSAGAVANLLLKDGSRVNAGQAIVVLEE
ncbi:Acetyl-/propionyl-coenzyme A carboxylase alpha chain [Marinomonas spartinae]|uniref:Biotin carboxylase n=1 Tax=Marinomonas spartinae TaxID=1792290 RepID=A0A1A8TP05_9GAMM|nr:urea carboxylase [Marinomonas spartinae]SBS35001.1 Acetyl-/propionyl-coenzyme A carboxylase alpha chain [Marinomonas spartinae]